MATSKEFRVTIARLFFPMRYAVIFFILFQLNLRILNQVKISDVSVPKLFNNATVSMPLMDFDDYFIREGRITVIGGKVTLQVSVDNFKVDDPNNCRFSGQEKCLS